MSKFLVPLMLCFSAVAATAQQSAVVSNRFYVSGPGPLHTYHIAHLPTNDYGDYDHLHLVMTLNDGWGANANSTIDMSLGNRGTFDYTYTVRGSRGEGGPKFTAYQNQDTSVDLYLVVPGTFGTVSYTVLENVQEDVYQTPDDLGTATPPGTLRFDSSQPLIYPPASFSDFANNLFLPAAKVAIGTTNLVGALTIGNTAPDHQGSPANGIVFVDTIYGNYETSNAHAAIYPDGSSGWNGSLVFATDGDSQSGFGLTEKMRIDPAGHVGIGTSTPNSPLEVNGNIQLDGSGGILFPDGSLQTHAATSTIGSNGVTTIMNSQGTAGFEFAPSTQGIGGAFGAGGNLTLQSNSVTDTLNSGGYINLGGSGRGDGLINKVVIAGNTTPGVNVTSSGIVVNGSNNVGIGLNPYTDPGARLEVNGDVRLTQGSGASIIFPDTSVQATAWNGVLTGGDYAESVNVSGDREQYEPGDVMVIDPDSEGKFLKSSEPYSTKVSGIYSTKPGVVGRRQLTARAHMKEEVPMAMTGIVPTRVSAENGPIIPGDLLVTSSKPGYAMKGTDRALMLGAVIGKAIGHLDSDTGVIEAVVTLQ